MNIRPLGCNQTTNINSNKKGCNNNLPAFKGSITADVYTGSEVFFQIRVIMQHIMNYLSPPSGKGIGCRAFEKGGNIWSKITFDRGLDNKANELATKLDAGEVDMLPPEAGELIEKLRGGELDLRFTFSDKS